MTAPAALDRLTLELLDWIGPDARPYAEVMDAWRTSCPQLPVWEHAQDRGLIVRHRGQDGTPRISVSATGRAVRDRAREDAGEARPSSFPHRATGDPRMPWGA
jgi:hypothetical protein